MSDWVREAYEEHHRQLFLVAWLVLRRTDLAEDAVHMAFSHIISRPPQLNGNAKAYVLKAVRNAAIDLHRANARIEANSVNHCNEFPRQEALSSSTKKRIEAVYEALEKLDAITQEIIQLHIHEQMTFREIGELTDQPLQTVASRYRRGLKQIKAKLYDELGSD